MLSQPVLERIDDIKKEYQAFNESIADKIHIIEKDIMDNNELRSELIRSQRSLTPERNSGIGLYYLSISSKKPLHWQKKLR